MFSGYSGFLHQLTLASQSQLAEKGCTVTVKPRKSERLGAGPKSFTIGGVPTSGVLQVGILERYDMNFMKYIYIYIYILYKYAMPVWVT